MSYYHSLILEFQCYSYEFKIPSQMRVCGGIFSSYSITYDFFVKNITPRGRSFLFGMQKAE